MNIVLAHYHLNAGGVTQVIVSQLRALALLSGDLRPGRVGVLYGGRHEGWPAKLWEHFESGDMVPLDEVLLPLASLDYDQLPGDRHEALATEVTAMLTSHGFAPSDTVLHVHNHSLGKNASWPEALALLAKRGYRLMLQIHDFAEDFRPNNFRHLARSWHSDDPAQLAARQYLTGGGIHYATLTHRDQQLLSVAGIDQQHLHLLPNPIGEFGGLPPYGEVADRVRRELGIPTDATLVLYPVRGIRRKNIGELLLHAALSPDDTWHAITLAPQNPSELPSFERWRALAAQLQLRCLFDTCSGGAPKFLDTLAAADRLITTSVAEGFGMVFLECWLAGKPLVGRDLPAITGDFKNHGLEFPGLYEALLVPLELIAARDDLAEALQLSYDWACDAYSATPADGDEVQVEIERLLAAGTIDFALLPSNFQEQVVRAAVDAPDRTREILSEANPHLFDQLTGQSQDAGFIERNAQQVREAYSLETISHTLGAAYQALLDDIPPGEVQPAEHGARILQQFLRIDRLHAIRFEE